MNEGILISKKLQILVLALLLPASPVLGGLEGAKPGRAIHLTALPPSAFVLTPQAGKNLDVSHIPGLSREIASHIMQGKALENQGPLVLLNAGNQVFLIPQKLTEGSQALVISGAQGASKAELIPITQQMATALQGDLAKGDVASAFKTLGRAFDASAGSGPSGTPVAAPETASTKPSQASLAPAQTRTRLVEDSGKVPPPATEPEGKPRSAGAKPLPAPNNIDSSLPNLDAAFDMHVSHSYPGKEGVDPAERVAQMVDEYIAYKGMPDSKKHFIIKYFEIGDPPSGHSKVVQAVARLKAAGIKTTILTDFNQSLTGTFPKDEPHNTDFEHSTYKDGGPGRALKYLREELGFSLKYGEGPFTVLSGVPLFNPREKGEKPLMHDKGVAAEGPDGKAHEFAEAGTANMNATEEKTPGPLPAYGGRYNRVIRSKDPAANQVSLKHDLAEIEAYDKRLGSKGLSEDLNVPQRINYPSGEFVEKAYTNGQQNPNERITNLFLRATQALSEAKALKDKGQQDAQPEFEIEEVIFSHFVLTYTPEVEAIRKWLDALRAFYPDDYQKRVKVSGVFDQQFISPDGWGEAAALDGILVQRPMGKSIFPFRSEYSAMMNLFGYIRLLTGVDKIDPEAAPTKVHIWHDKTTVIKTKEKDAKAGQSVRWTHAFTLSFNNSGHYQSLESQDWLRMSPDSRLAKEFEDSIQEVVKAEPEYAIPLDKAVLMVFLSHITHHTIYDEEMGGYAEKATEALIKQDYSLVESLITEVAALPTKHVSPVDAALLKEGIARFIGFMNWYADEAKKDSSLNKMTYRKAVNIGVGLASQNLWGLRTALDLLYWGPKRSPAQMEQLMRKAWTEGLKMDVPFPEPKNSGDDKGVVAK